MQTMKPLCSAGFGLIRRKFPICEFVAVRRLKSTSADNVTAKWKGAVIAECDEKEIVIVEGNSYFPANAVSRQFLVENPTEYTCPWKGACQYYDVVVDGSANKAAAWSYPNPKPAAMNIKGYFAFYKGVTVGSG